jgi:hypothetical protein
VLERSPLAGELHVVKQVHPAGAAQLRELRHQVAIADVRVLVGRLRVVVRVALVVLRVHEQRVDVGGGELLDDRCGREVLEEPLRHAGDGLVGRVGHLEIEQEHARGSAEPRQRRRPGTVRLRRRGSDSGATRDGRRQRCRGGGGK